MSVPVRHAHTKELSEIEQKKKVGKKSEQEKKTFSQGTGARFSKVPKHFGRHNSLCILKAKAFQDTKLHSYFNFPSHYIMWKDQLY